MKINPCSPTPSCTIKVNSPFNLVFSERFSYLFLAYPEPIPLASAKARSHVRPLSRLFVLNCKCIWCEELSLQVAWLLESELEWTVRKPGFHKAKLNKLLTLVYVIYNNKKKLNSELSHCKQ